MAHRFTYRGAAPYPLLGDSRHGGSAVRARVAAYPDAFIRVGTNFLPLVFEQAKEEARSTDAVEDLNLAAPSSTRRWAEPAASMAWPRPAKACKRDQVVSKGLPLPPASLRGAPSASSAALAA